MSTGYTHAVVLDFEATCEGRQPPRPQEIIEFPSVLVALDTGEMVDEFAAFVRPHHHPTLSEFCTSLTSIVQADVDGADLFADVFARHQQWLAGHGLDERNALLVTCGDWDLDRMLPMQCAVAVPEVVHVPPIYTRWQNVKQTFCEVHDRAKAGGMARMLGTMNIPLVGRHHRGIDDCRNIATLYLALLALGARPGITAELPVAKYLPIVVRLRRGNRREQVRLESRSLQVLEGLANEAFKRRVGKLRREDGSVLAGDADLLTLTPDEELVVSS